MVQGFLRSTVRGQLTAWCLAALWPGLLAAQPAALAAPGDPDVSAVAAVIAAWVPPSHREASADPVRPEPLLRLAVQQALWPADIVRLCAEYLRLYPQAPWAGDADQIRQRALVTADLLRQADVQLFRSAFDRPPADLAGTDDLRLAALGDPAAALRVALRVSVHGGSLRRHLGWLQYAAGLGSDEAAYALALHYRRDAQPLLAARYEAQAIALGFQPPPALGHRRR